jgi:Zn ribbon nucleic-acid-binding protein
MQAVVEAKRLAAKGYCPICTHLADLIVEEAPTRYGEKLAPVAGQRCPRCSTSIGSASIVEVLGPAADSVEASPESAQPRREWTPARAEIVEAAYHRRGRARQ